MPTCKIGIAQESHIFSTSRQRRQAPDAVPREHRDGGQSPTRVSSKGQMQETWYGYAQELEIELIYGCFQKWGYPHMVGL